MKKKVLAFSQLPPSLKDQVSAHFDLLQINPALGDIDAQFKALLPQADGLIGVGRKLDADLLKLAVNLKVVSSISVGYDNYDLAYLNERGILLTNTPDVLTETTADLGFALLMSAARRVPELDAWTKQGLWKKTIPSAQFGVDVFGKTLGIIGLGHIGAAIARRGHAGFGMQVLYHNRREKPELAATVNAQFCSLQHLLQQSDFVVVTVDLNAQTHHLLSHDEFALMKSSAILVNVARGAVVDEQALIHALQQGQILSAGLDVYEQEPLQESPLFSMPQVVTLPHIGSATHATRQAMSDLAFDNLFAALTGATPRYMVNPQVLVGDHIVK